MFKSELASEMKAVQQPTQPPEERHYKQWMERLSLETSCNL